MRATIQVYGDTAGEIIENWAAEADRFFGIGASDDSVPFADRTYAGYDVGPPSLDSVLPPRVRGTSAPALGEVFQAPSRRITAT